jgi:hypothetical protein
MSCFHAYNPRTNTILQTAQPKNGYRHYLALPAHHPIMQSRNVIERMKNEIMKITTRNKRISAWNATAYNERFSASGAVARLKVSANLQVLRPSERQWKPRLRKAAGTLYAMRGQRYR